jgi:hypothetical protein
VHFHHTPTHASWVNLVECFFSILGKQGLSHRVDRSKQSLRGFLHQYLDTYDKTGAPFTWTKGPETPQRMIESPHAFQAGHPAKRRNRTERRKTIPRLIARRTASSTASRSLPTSSARKRSTKEPFS